MKTKIFPLLSLLCLANTVFAQHTLESNANRPRPTDKLIKQEVLFKEPGRTGKNVLWDFSQLSPVKKIKPTLTQPIETIDPNSDITQYLNTVNNSETPVEYFEEDSGKTVAGSDHGTIYRYNPSGDSLLIWGYELPEIKVTNTLPEIWITYPFHYKDKLFSYYSGDGICGDQMGVTLMGSVETEADAYGIIILPNKDTLDNVLRIKTIKTTIDDKTPIYVKKNGKQVKVKQDSIKQALKLNKKRLLKTEVIRWYAEGYRYPVFETWKTYNDKEGKKSDENLKAFFYHPLDQEENYLLATDTINTLIVEKKKKQKEKKKDRLKSVESGQPTGMNELSGLRYNVYPNPTKGDLQVEIYLQEETPLKLALYSMQGKIVYQSHTDNCTGIYMKTIPTTSLPKGNYILNIICGEKIITEKIIRQ